jgi:uncharacterized protein YraI
MPFLSGLCRPVPGQSIAVAFAVLVAALAAPLSGAAQTCTNCVLYAYTELNLRQEPSIDAPVLRFVPAGHAVQRTAEAERNGYAPVVYDGVPGWAIALGLVASPDDVAGVGGPTAAPEEPVAAPAGDVRFTLSPLLLRAEPSAEGEPILTMPEGATVTLTREGAQNGYVTVDFDGTRGWAYADLLGGDS